MTTTYPTLSVHDGGQEMTTHTLDNTQLWRQVGWLGFSGIVYDMADEPFGREPAGWSILWVLVDNEPPVTNGDES